jgi:hypothetical protein
MNKAVRPFSSTEWICSGNLAAASGHDDVARLLLTSGSDILAVDNRGWSALHKPHRGTLTIRGGDEQSGLAFFVH